MVFKEKDVVSFQAVAVLNAEPVVEISRRHNERNWEVDYKLEGTVCHAVVPAAYLRKEDNGRFGTFIFNDGTPYNPNGDNNDDDMKFTNVPLAANINRRNFIDITTEINDTVGDSKLTHANKVKRVQLAIKRVYCFKSLKQLRQLYFEFKQDLRNVAPKASKEVLSKAIANNLVNKKKKWAAIAKKEVENRGGVPVDLPDDQGGNDDEKEDPVPDDGEEDEQAFDEDAPPPLENDEEEVVEALRILKRARKEEDAKPAAKKQKIKTCFSITKSDGQRRRVSTASAQSTGVSALAAALGDHLNNRIDEEASSQVRETEESNETIRWGPASPRH
eukprot:g79609.t1